MTRHAAKLRHVEAFAPPKTFTVEEIGESCGLNRYQIKMFQRYRGLSRLHWDPELNLFDLLAIPAQAVLRHAPAHRIRYLILAHTFHELTPSYVIAAQTLRDRLGLARAEAFTVTQQNCASGFAAVDIAAELLRADGDTDGLALIVTGEKPFTGLKRFLINVSIMGEASAACLVGLGGDGSRVVSYAAKTRGEFSDCFRMDPEAQREFGSTYNTYLLEVMEEALAACGLGFDDLEMVIPHNVSRTAWLQLCATAGLEPERVFLDNLAEYSHCFCSDPFLNLVSMRERGLLVRGARYLMTSVGIGSTYAAMVIEY
jgi:3-oxoacyl-[acyl-carrier-protein] synthase-3